MNISKNHIQACRKIFSQLDPFKDTGQRCLASHNSAQQAHEHSADIDCQLELDEFLDRQEHVATPHHGLFDRVEVVVQENDVRSLFRDFSSGNT